MRSKAAIAALAATFAMCLPASADIMQLTVTGEVTSRTIRLLPDYSTIFSGPLSDTFVMSVRYDTNLGLHYSAPTEDHIWINASGAGSPFLNVTFMLGGQQLFSLANPYGSLSANQYGYQPIGGRFSYGREYWGSFNDGNGTGVGFGFRSPDILLSLTTSAHYALTSEYRWGEVDELIYSGPLAPYQLTRSLNPQFIDISPVSAVPGPVAGAGLPGLLLASLGWLGWRRRARPPAPVTSL
jgi:hypothetical protein